MVSIFFLLLGYILTIIGLTYIISYLNLLVIGYNKLEYVNFIISRIECRLFLFGMLILILTIIFTKGDD